MALMRAFAKIDEKGRVPLPGNIRRLLELKPGQLLELKVVGASKAKQVLLSARTAAR